MSDLELQDLMFAMFVLDLTLVQSCFTVVIFCSVIMYVSCVLVLWVGDFGPWGCLNSAVMDKNFKIELNAFLPHEMAMSLWWPGTECGGLN